MTPLDKINTQVGNLLPNLQNRLIYKYSFNNPLFTEHDLILNWELSETVLITAYDLLKDDYLVNYLNRTGLTLKEYLCQKGFNKEIKILGDTGIFEFEAKKAHLDIEAFENIPHEFTTNDIYFAYDLMDPDYLISPDSIILQTDSKENAKNKINDMITLFERTHDKFSDRKHKIIGVLQGFDEETLQNLLDVYSKEKNSIVARGGLIPLWTESKQKFDEIITLTENVVNDYQIDKLHSFGLPSLTTIKNYFVDNAYSSLDTSIIYYRTAERLYLTQSGFFISVNKALANFRYCACKGCSIMSSSKYFTNSSQFVLGLYYHNCHQLNKLVEKQLQTKEQVFHPKKFYIERAKDTFNINDSSYELNNASEFVFTKKYPFFIPKKSKLNQEYRILVIQNCTKRKNLNTRSFSLYELRSQDQRNKIVNSDVPKLTCRELYFTQKMNETVDFLREKRFLIDYLFISAGFGLIDENMQLPNYDCSFTRKDDEFLAERSKELLIIESIEKLTHYDLIYVTAFDNYLKVLNLDTLKKKGTELVFYNSHTVIRDNIISINAMELQDIDLRHKILPIDLYTNVKENLIKNYGLFKIAEQSTSFKNFITVIKEKKYSLRIY